MRNSENHSANNTYISTSNRYQELPKNDVLKMRVIPAIMQSQQRLRSQNQTTSGKINNSGTRKNSTNPVIHNHKKSQQHVKKNDDVAVILEDCQGLKRMGTLK